MPTQSLDVIYAIYCPFYVNFKEEIYRILKTGGFYKIKTWTGLFVVLMYELIAPGFGFVFEKNIPDTIYTKTPNTNIAIFMKTEALYNTYTIPFDKRVDIVKKIVNGLYGATKGTSIITEQKLFKFMINKGNIMSMRDFRFWHNVYLLIDSFYINVTSKNIDENVAIEKLKEIGLEDAWVKK